MSADQPEKPTPPFNPDDVNGDWKPSGVELDSEGKLTKTEGNNDRRPKNVVSGLEFARKPKAKAPEPVAAAAPVDRPTFMSEPPQKRQWGSKLLALLILSALGAGIFWLYRNQSPSHLNRPLLSIQSSPEGAHVFVDGRDLGQTPVFTDNVWKVGDVTFEVRKPGFLTYSGQFQGATEVRLNIRLERAVRTKP